MKIKNLIIFAGCMLLIGCQCSKEPDLTTLNQISNKSIVEEFKLVKMLENGCIITKFKDAGFLYEVKWTIFTNYNFSNGFIIIKRIKCNDDIFTFDCDDVTYVNNIDKDIEKLNIKYNKDSFSDKLIFSNLRIAEAIIIVSYSHKEYNINNYSNEVYTTLERMQGRKEGLPLSKINYEKIMDMKK